MQARLPTGAGQTLWRGFCSRCPACGEGRMFRAFLKVADQCPRCGEELRRVSYDSYEIVYCPSCQTKGKILADRRLSRLLR